jgi:excinuclease ABC subunit C
MSSEIIKAALERLPQDPGVYLMKDARGKIIYVGKAKRLKARVASYAREEAAPSWYRQKVLAMVAQVEAVEFIVTMSEKEALLLEATLIKRHRPRYNVDLRDDKTYPYFRLSLKDEFPRFSLVRRPDLKDGARYFGPFESAGAARKTLHWLQRIFPLRRCSDAALKGRARPCLDAEMGRCLAPCAGRVGAEEYQALAKQLAAFFAGEGEAVAAELERRMRQAAQTEQFERAAVLRDRWQALAKTLERQRVSAAEGRDLDVLGLHDDGGAPRLAVLKVRGGRVVASQVHDLGRAALTAEEALGQALVALYQEAAPPPPLVLVSHMPPEPGLVAEVLAELAGRRVELRKPQRGDKKGLMELALINAAQPRRAEAAAPAEVLEGLQRKLGLVRLPTDMECVDISHLGGRLTVASVVAMRDGLPHKANYRRYKVLSLGPEPDDYAAMAEVVGRRLGGDRPPPDLLVVDGGRGQLSMALKAMEELPEEKRPMVIALAKGRPGEPGSGPMGQGGQGGQAGEPDRVYLPGRKNPAPLKPRDPELLLLMRLRDEAHRFAITYHRLLRSKALTRSILDEAPGVGPGKRQKLLKAFGSLAAIKAAPAEELASRAGVDLPTARGVAAFLGCLDSLPPPE